MARQRRGRGFRPPELRGTLGTLLRTTLEQAGAVRDALERGARSRFDEARSHRRRKDALAELGELVLELIRRGEIDLTELPEAHDLIRQLDDLDADEPHDPDDRIAQPPTRRRFDARARDAEPTYDRDRARDPEPARDRDRDLERVRDRDRDRDLEPGRDRDRDLEPPRDRDRNLEPARDRPLFRDREPAPDRADRAPLRDRDRPRALDRDHDSLRDRPRPFDRDSDDGTVSAIRGDRSAGTRSGASGPSSSDPGSSSSAPRWAPPKPSAPQRVWRPSLVDDEPPSDARGAAPRDFRDERDAIPARDSRHDRDAIPARDSRHDRDTGPARDPRRDPRTAHDPREPRDVRPPSDSRPVRALPHDPHRPLDPHRKGGIQFDDEDLADYMHPDDVPPKPPSDDDR